MAVTVYTYNHTASMIGMGYVPLSDWVVMLCTSLTFDATQTTLTSVVRTEVANGNGYTTNGQYLSNQVATIVSTDDAVIDADNVVWTATGGSISANHALIYCTSGFVGDVPLFALDLGGTVTATSGNDFSINWDATNGIFKLSKV